MGFFGLVNSYTIRLSLSVAITQMVAPPIKYKNDQNDETMIEIICPYTDERFIEEHRNYTAVFNSLYNSVS